MLQFAKKLSAEAWIALAICITVLVASYIFVFVGDEVLADSILGALLIAMLFLLVYTMRRPKR